MKDRELFFGMKDGNVVESDLVYLHISGRSIAHGSEFIECA
jgi:hypothetical protein